MRSSRCPVEARARSATGASAAGSASHGLWRPRRRVFLPHLPIICVGDTSTWPDVFEMTPRHSECSHELQSVMTGIVGVCHLLAALTNSSTAPRILSASPRGPIAHHGPTS